MHMDSKTQRKWQPICRHLRFWISKDAKSRRVLEQIATLCPPFRGSRSFLSVLGKQFFHSNMSWTGWHIWWHWQRGKMSAKLSVFRISAAPGSPEWTQWHWLVGWRGSRKENSCRTRTSQSLHQTAASQSKIICVENSSKGRFFETWIVENMLQEREAGYWPSPFWWVSLQDFSAPNSGNKAWTNSSAVGFLVSKWMR